MALPTRHAPGNRRIRITPKRNNPYEGSIITGRESEPQEDTVDPSAPPVAYARYYTDTQERIEGVLSDPQMPVDEMVRIAHDPDAPTWIQAALAKNPALPTVLVDKLIASPHVSVAITAIRNNNRSTKIVNQILTDNTRTFTNQVTILARSLKNGLSLVVS